MARTEINTRSHDDALPKGSKGKDYKVPDEADGFPSKAEPATTRKQEADRQHDRDNTDERKAATKAGKRDYEASEDAQPNKNVEQAKTRSSGETDSKRSKEDGKQMDSNKQKEGSKQKVDVDELEVEDSEKRADEQEEDEAEQELNADAGVDANTKVNMDTSVDAPKTRSKDNALPPGSKGKDYELPGDEEGLPSGAEPATTRKAAADKQHDQDNLEKRKKSNKAGKRDYDAGDDAKPDDSEAAKTRSEGSNKSKRSKQGTKMAGTRLQDGSIDNQSYKVPDESDGVPTRS
eukprot:TRINITY_DN24832_c0_g1_i1.p1 TRINITY_DN24832_c0_g1~~TRINITY_DN24832_c0_g1_i1.p1  ORF type:complete len:291 (+),score=108.66 TRINITY_DN24832_c0_g1_i1:33-905(+)